MGEREWEEGTIGGGKDGGGVGTTKAAAIAVIRHGGGAR